MRASARVKDRRNCIALCEEWCEKVRYFVWLGRQPTFLTGKAGSASILFTKVSSTVSAFALGGSKLSAHANSTFLGVVGTTLLWGFTSFDIFFRGRNGLINKVNYIKRLLGNLGHGTRQSVKSIIVTETVKFDPCVQDDKPGVEDFFQFSVALISELREFFSISIIGI